MDSIPAKGGLSNPIGLYNLIPHPGQAGLLGFSVPILKGPIYLVIGPRTESDYGLDIEAKNITHLLPLSFIETELWGVPADPAHTEERHPVGCDPFFEGQGGTIPCYPGVPSNSPLKPFIDNPTTCGVPLTASVDVVSYDLEETHASRAYPATTGCDQLSFNPSLFGQPTQTSTDSASGIDIDLKVPQNDSPSVPSASEIRATSVTLPEGFSINPNAADGKVACTDSEAQIGTREPAQCPEYSKVGTLTLESSALPGALLGYIYLGEPRAGDRFRLILVADGFSVHIKLLGSVTPDPQTGRLTVSFPDLPQAPFSDFNMHFFGSERALTATPVSCGTFTVTSTFTPWNVLVAEQTSAQSSAITSGPGGAPCPAGSRPFAPSLRAGVTDKTAAVHAPFQLEVKRDDGDQNLGPVTIKTPPGFSASLAGVTYCPEAAIAATADASSHTGLAERNSPLCPASSQIGTGSTGVGAGTHPVYFDSKVYLAGPYKGAPLSLVVVTPALTGPYDLDNVVVRSALHVDPTDAHVTTVSDPLPVIHEGIPLRIRSVLIDLNRPGFTLNPTNCDPLSVDATIGGSEGATARLSRHFQAANCASLNFEPKLSFRLSGGTKRAQNPALHTVVTMKPEGANIARALVSLPGSIQLDNSHIQSPCTRVQFAADACPASSILGTASAETPLLDAPLKGSVYLRSSSNPLPDLVVALRGQVDINLVGRIGNVGGGLSTTFEAVPDVPVSRFSLSLNGGSKGLLINNQDLCRRAQKVTTKLRGQNGKPANARTSLRLPCGKAKRKRKAHRHPHRVKSAGDRG